MRVSGIPFVKGRNVYGDMNPSGIAIHCTDNDASAEDEAQYATRRTDGVGSHFYVDSNSIVQSIDTNQRTGHAGSSNGNRNSIAVEITGRTSWTRAQWLDRVAWGKLGPVLAQVCQHHNIPVRRLSVTSMTKDPRTRGFYGHDDMRLAWGGTTHTDPGPNFPWDHLLRVVQSGEDDEMTPADFLKILNDPAVTNKLRAVGWQYVGGGIPAGLNTLNVLNNINTRTTDTHVAVTALTALVIKMADQINEGGGNFDTGAVLSGVREIVDRAVSALAVEQRDAVADLGEGGASQVRDGQGQARG